MIAADAASEIIGVPLSAATSRIASELGVVDEPMITSTLSSLTSLRVLVTAFVVSDASSRTTQLIFSPPIVAGSSSMVFFCGMPSDAAGPVADTVTPIVTSASADVAASANATAAPSAGRDLTMLHTFPPVNRCCLGIRRGDLWQACANERREFDSGKAAGAGQIGGIAANGGVCVTSRRMPRLRRSSPRRASYCTWPRRR